MLVVLGVVVVRCLVGVGAAGDDPKARFAVGVLPLGVVAVAVVVVVVVVAFLAPTLVLVGRVAVGFITDVRLAGGGGLS